jgi:stearoyl-CoA desaturase (delta-9 desaturase)
MQLNHKVKLVTILQHVIAVAGVAYYGITWAGVITALVFYFVFFGLGISGGFHKLFCHRSFKTNKFWRRTLLAIGTFSGFGSSIAWSLSHRLHHKFSDQGIDVDPYYPQANKFTSWWVTPRNVPYNPLIIKDMLVDAEQLYIHTHYFKILFTFVLLLTAVNPWLTVFAWAIPNVLGYHAIQAVGTLSHSYGTQPYDNRDNSRDNIFVGILTFGEGFQNTHHQYPGWYKLDRTDIVGIIIDKFIKK